MRKAAATESGFNRGRTDKDMVLFAETVELLCLYGSQLMRLEPLESVLRTERSIKDP